MSYLNYGCPKRGVWIGLTVLFFLTTVTFLTLFLLQKYKPSLLLGPYGLKQSCSQQTDCIEGLTCVMDSTTNEGMCLCGGATLQAAPATAPIVPPPAV